MRLALFDVFGSYAVSDYQVRFCMICLVDMVRCVRLSVMFFVARCVWLGVMCWVAMCVWLDVMCMYG